MTTPLPTLTMTPQPTSLTTDKALVEWDWGHATALPPLSLADGSGLAEQQTAIHLCYDEMALHLRFICEDSDIWGTFTERDDPIYDEEVVELFIAPTQREAAPPTVYYEFEFSPNGVLFDARVHNPTGERADMQVDIEWNCDGIVWHVEREDEKHSWQVFVTIPWVSISPAGDRSDLWRVNFYRIERPRGGTAEYSCWSPTMTEPADFHKPAYFGLLKLEK